MAPIATSDLRQVVEHVADNTKKLFVSDKTHAGVEQTKATDNTRTYHLPSGVLNQFEQFDVTPVIGREFPKANLVEWINSPNADELLKELAYISEIADSARVRFN